MIRREDFPGEWNGWYSRLRQEPYEPSGLDKIFRRHWEPFREGEVRTLDLIWGDDKLYTFADEDIRKLRILNYDPRWFNQQEIREYFRSPDLWPSLEELEVVCFEIAPRGETPILGPISRNIGPLAMMRAAIRFLGENRNHDLTWMTMDDSYDGLIRMDEIGLERFTFKAFERNRRGKENFMRYQQRILQDGPPRTIRHFPRHLKTPGPAWTPDMFQKRGRIKGLVFLGDTMPSPRYIDLMRTLCPRVLVLILDPRSLTRTVLEHFKVFVCEDRDTGAAREMFVDDLRVQPERGPVLNVGGGLKRRLVRIEEEEEVRPGEEAGIDGFGHQPNLLEQEAQ